MDVQVPPGMGLPLELWWHIISFLELEPSALLSCCRTCQSFQGVAQQLLWGLIRTEMKPPDLEAIDMFVDGVRQIGRFEVLQGDGGSVKLGSETKSQSLLVHKQPHPRRSRVRLRLCCSSAIPWALV